MPFQIIRNDITKVAADAIVNTANPRPVIGSGTDSAIYRAAGEALLLAERQKIGAMVPGQAAATPAFGLQARHIIHTVGPAWQDGQHGEREALHQCYQNSLQLADQLGCQSIAFPLIATGVYGFPKDEALQIALREIQDFLMTHEMDVILVVFDQRAFTLSGRLVSDIEEYIDEHDVQRHQDLEYGMAYKSLARRRRDARRDDMTLPTMASREVLFDAFDDAFEESAPSLAGQADTFEEPEFPGRSEDVFAGKTLDEVLANSGDSFQKRLFQLIDERGLDDVTVYKRANIDRKTFSKIRCNEAYHPKKKTAVALAVALELDMATMQDLLARAELAFSPSNRFDLIISYFVSNKNYDLFEINASLFKYGQDTLGA